MNIAEPLRGTKDLVTKGNFQSCISQLHIWPFGVLQQHQMNSLGEKGSGTGRRFPTFVPGRYPGTWNKILLRCLGANSKAHHSFHKHFHISGHITCTALVAGYAACESQNIVRLKDCLAAQQTMEQEREFP